MAWQCRFGLHNWTNWHDHPEYLNQYGLDEPIMHYNPLTKQLDKIKTIQHKWCQNCYKAKFKSVVVYHRQLF